MIPTTASGCDRNGECDASRRVTLSARPASISCAGTGIALSRSQIT
jgi:hypothetical protein